MTRIDFYILSSSPAEQRIQVTCKIVQKAFRAGHNIYIHCDDPSMASTVDEHLWQYPPYRFIPHTVYTNQQNESNQHDRIGIGCHEAPDQHHDVLVLLSHDMLPSFSRFERVIEVVSQAPDVLETTRKRYHFYQQRHYPLHTHKLTTNSA